MIPPVYFLIADGTGRQGGAVVQALLQHPDSAVLPGNFYVITRDLQGSAAIKLADAGVNLVPGTLGSPEAIFQHLKRLGVRLSETAAFLAQAHGATELDDARGFINAAVASGLQYFVYSSIDRGGKELSDPDPSYCESFSDKYYIEKYLIAATSGVGKKDECSKVTDYTILRPTWFAENIIWGFPGRLCMTGWRDNMKGKRLQIVVAKDLGRWAAEALLHPDRANLRNEAVSITSDELTFREIDEIFRQETGKSVEVTYAWLAAFIIWAVKDLHTMFAFINERDYGADLQELSKYVEPTKFRQWLRATIMKEARRLSL